MKWQAKASKSQRNRGLFTVSAVILFVAQITRILAHQAPTEQEAWLTASVYVPWIYFCWRDSEQLENHYAVTFYASCGALDLPET